MSFPTKSCIRHNCIETIKLKSIVKRHAIILPVCMLLHRATEEQGPKAIKYHMSTAIDYTASKKVSLGFICNSGLLTTCAVIAPQPSLQDIQLPPALSAHFFSSCTIKPKERAGRTQAQWGLRPAPLDWKSFCLESLSLLAT